MLFMEKYVIDHKICETSGSLIYQGHDTYTKSKIIIKLEKESTHHYLLNETKIRKFLEGCYGIPPLLEYGTYQTKRFIIYPWLNSTLQRNWMEESKLYECAQQLINILEKIHKYGVVHCDISASNILYDLSQKKYYINDFGQAQHFSYGLGEKRNEKLKGCPLFCSYHVHEGHEYAPRDDLISLGFVLVYCYSKGVEWSGMKTCAQIYEKKMEFKENLWEKQLPHDIKIYLNYCFHLGMNEAPKYDMLKGLFKVSRNIEKEINIYT